MLCLAKKMLGHLATWICATQNFSSTQWAAGLKKNFLGNGEISIHNFDYRDKMFGAIRS
ncbi:hypothetical protein SAMN05518668_109174 [Sphingobium sp. YR657]|nr:hypothetical protein SAMN05518668_109174 [Sphingobium sp. YR657]